MLFKIFVIFNILESIIEEFYCILLKYAKKHEILWYSTVKLFDKEIEK